MSKPLVSVLIPTYNGERFLRPALRSALTQSYRDIEVIVGDDASNDGTAKILAEAAAGDARVRVIRHETNLGALGNWTHVLSEARGEYVKYLLHDDVLATDCIRDLVKGMEAAPETTMAFSRRVLIDENGRPVEGHSFPVLQDRPGVIDGRELGDLMLETCVNHIGEATTVLFRRSAVDPAGWYQVDGRLLDANADVKLWLMLLARGPAYYTPQVLSRFRKHPGQNTWNPELQARGARDWPRLLDWAVRAGFLTDHARQRKAFATSLLMCAGAVSALSGHATHGPSLEGAFLATSRLVELGSDSSAAEPVDLQRRAHDPMGLQRFTQELDVWIHRFPIALAAPAVEAGEIAATVEALRAISATGRAERLLLAVPEDAVDAAVPLVEAALADGPDIDVELVPTGLPGMILPKPWLAVATPGSTWHDGRATAVWTVRAPNSDEPGAPGGGNVPS